MSDVEIMRDGVRLAGVDVGQGPPVIFQHGLTGDRNQVAEHFPEGRFRRLTLECRAHGKSEAGDPVHFSIPKFAEDVLAFADSRGVENFAVGGISMGAAIALRLAVIAPKRVNKLILARPAWAWNSAPENMRDFITAASYVRCGDRKFFLETEISYRLLDEAPDNHASFLKLFDRNDSITTAELISRIAASGPDVSPADVLRIKNPTLIFANGLDLVHPMSLAKLLHEQIHGSQFIELPPKTTDRTAHVAAFRAAVTEFLECGT